MRHRTQAHQLAVARRRSVPQKVSRAIVETHDEDVITALLKNGDAEISRGLMEYLVAESKRVDTFQNPLVDRHDLPPDLARRMYWWVSAAVRQHIVENFQVDATVIDDHIEESVNEALERDNLAKSERDPTEAQKLAAQMAERSEIDEGFLVNTLRQGEITLFEACFAETTGLRITLMRRLLYEPGGEGLAVACKAAGFGRATYTTIFQLTREVTSHAGAYDPREVNRVAEFFNRLEADHASDVIKRWKRDADYLHALSQIEESS